MFIRGDWNEYTNMQTQSVTRHKTCRICGAMQNRSSIIDLNLVWPCNKFSTLEHFESPGSICTVLLRKSKLFISESCPILVLTTILSNPRRANSRKCDSKIQNFPHTFFKILVWLWPTSKFVSVLARSQSYLQRATSGLYIFKSVILLYVQLCSGG